MIEDFDACYRAVKSRDRRFDGWFFTAVVSTGIYCRPSCPASTPKPANVRFYRTAAAAQEAGFRACKRCRPSAAPGSPEWEYRGDVVARAMRLIGDGVCDRDGTGGLSSALGYSPRQLQRILLEGTGAGPVALARAQRAQSARALIESTAMTFSDIAFAAGFSSVRQFNETVKGAFALPPSGLRARARKAEGDATARPPLGVRAQPSPVPSDCSDRWHRVLLRLTFRDPFCPDNLFGHLAATAVPGVEQVVGTTYRRTLRLPHGPAIIALTPAAAHVRAELLLADVKDLVPAVSRARRMLDLDADPVAVHDALCSDVHIGRLVRAVPGRRVPGTADADEMAVKAVVGQQVSTLAARTIASRLAEAAGPTVADPQGSLKRLFPSPAELHRALTGPGNGPQGLPLLMPQARRRALIALVDRLASGELDLGPGSDREQARRLLSSIPGIGHWTVEIIAMRALGDPDAFPATDAGLLRAAAGLGLPGSPVGLQAHSGAWRPWRSYATQYLWAVLDHPVNRFPPAPTNGRSLDAVVPGLTGTR